MKTPLLALGIAAVLAAGAYGSLAVAGLGGAGAATHAAHAAGADMAAMHGGMAGDMQDAQLGMERLAFPLAAGNVPSAGDAKSLTQVSFIQVAGDKGATPANGIRSGSGTLADPYVISGYDVTGDVDIQDTGACYEIAGNWIDGQLRLNWNGQCVHVHHNFIRDLRVNENIQRVGDDTGGLIELNQIGYVGQIRHYDGEFRNNVVGPRDDGSLPNGVFRDPENVLPFAKDTRVLNVDGWNEALFAHNTIYGSVDLKLHGHHHSTGFLATHSHYHGDNETVMAGMPHDHTDRWSSVDFADNKVIDPTGYGVRYSDEAHAGDDRTANSESTKALEEPHQHHTWVTIERNELQGAGLIVDIFNADDELHKWYNPGWLTIADNRIDLQGRDPGILGTQFFGPTFEPNTGILIAEAKEVQLHVMGNHMSFTPATQQSPTAPLAQLLPFLYPQQDPIGIHVVGVRNANLTLHANGGSGFTYGVWAQSLDDATAWYLLDNHFDGAAHAVYYDSSVANKPVDGPGPDTPVEAYGQEAPGHDKGHHAM